MGEYADLRALLQGLRAPMIVAPMLRVSGLELTAAVCAAGAIGAFPTVNARTPERLDEWLSALDQLQSEGAAPYCPNLIIKAPTLAEHLGLICAHEAKVVITSVGSPAPVIEPLHKAGCAVLADVASLAHARRAAESGADGLVLLTAGAGGQTGWLNPFAFVAAVREFYDGVLVVAGGMSHGRSLLAAQVAGYDAGYFGTRFIATEESLAQQAYRDLLTTSSMDDVLLTKAFTGLQTNMLRPAIEASGIDPDRLDESVTPDLAGRLFGDGADGPKRWQQIWSAGHTVSSVDRVAPAAELVAQIVDEYADCAAAQDRAHLSMRSR
ncbi:nitronate monooxygenase [Epidermidibacterium keratini]|uniref:Nitronate monooxygenase n=1 Tax=Epidermidibacterium keratini TaxID=1891644 RepID=A0A7L4YQK9_9ACTN|nr:nitronate monooxygenase [Epidermidibacterium keratini]QHC01223.1 nitronate monooxygenase [Epidermidibacterium keratini]